MVICLSILVMWESIHPVRADIPMWSEARAPIICGALYVGEKSADSYTHVLQITLEFTLSLAKDARAFPQSFFPPPNHWTPYTPLLMKMN